MVNPDYNILPTGIVQALLDRIAPGSKPVSIRLAEGSYSNYTHLLTALDAHNVLFSLVVRRYRVFGSYDRGQKACREYAALRCVRRNGIPAPQTLLLDETGEVLGIPGIVTRYVSGGLLDPPVDSHTWVSALAETLAMIHGVPCDPATRSLLLNANAEATWFLRGGSAPDYMRAHPDGLRIWETINRHYPDLPSMKPVLVHLDYWPGNVLWQDGKITAVVDWEEAALGDPAIDVAYCRMDLYLRGLPQAAEEFLRAYESAVGRSLANLGFWELAAAARPIFAPQGWIDASPQKELFAAFIEQAEQVVV